MSIQTEIDRINTSVAAAYAVLEGLGATMPTDRTVDYLAATAATIQKGTNPIQRNISLTVSGWADNLQTVSVDSVTANSVVFTGADIGSNQEYADCEVWCSGQSDGTLTFSCVYVPNEEITINAVIFN